MSKVNRWDLISGFFYGINMEKENRFTSDVAIIKKVEDLYKLCGITPIEVQNHLNDCVTPEEKNGFINNALTNIAPLKNEEKYQRVLNTIAKV